MSGGLSISFDTSGLRKLSADLTRMQKALPQAIARGLNEGGDKVRTEVQHALQSQTGLLRYRSVTSRIRTARAFAGQGGGMSYQIIATSKPPTRPSEFPQKVTTGPGGKVSIKLWNVWHVFARSFQIKGRTGDFSLRMRLGVDRKPIRGIRRSVDRERVDQG